MKIFIYYDSDNHDKIILVVTTAHFMKKKHFVGKSVAEVETMVTEMLNEEDKKLGWKAHSIIDVSDEIEHVIQFLIGEDYKSYRTITEVYNVLNDIRDDLDSMQDDCFHMCEFVEDGFKKVKNLVPEED